MSWTHFSEGFRLDREAEDPPEALVVLFDDVGAPAAALLAASARWATTVPSAAFVALDGPRSASAAGANVDPMSPKHVHRAAQHLEPLLVQELRTRGLSVERLVLVGVGSGGALALHMSLLRGWSCAGILAIGAKPMFSAPRHPRTSTKVRLIARVNQGSADHSGLRDLTASLMASGIDTRGVVLAGPTLSDEAIRHGGAYLVELVATAQRGVGARPYPETDHAT